MSRKEIVETLMSEAPTGLSRERNRQLVDNLIDNSIYMAEAAQRKLVGIEKVYVREHEKHLEGVAKALGFKVKFRGKPDNFNVYVQLPSKRHITLNRVGWRPYELGEEQ